MTKRDKTYKVIFWITETAEFEVQAQDRDSAEDLASELLCRTMNLEGRDVKTVAIELEK